MPAVWFAQPPLAPRLPRDRPDSPFPDALRHWCLPVPTNGNPSGDRSGLVSGREKHCLGCPQDLLASLTRLLPIEVELSLQPGTQNPTTLFPRAGWQGQGGGNRAGSDYRCAKITLLNHIRHSSRRHKGPEKRWHYDRPPWPLLDLSRPWGLSGNSWLASPTVAPWEAGCRNHAMCFWLCREHLVLNKTCPQEPLPNRQQSSSLGHHHRQAQHQHRIPFTYRFSISSRLSKSLKQKQICVYVCSSI